MSTDVRIRAGVLLKQIQLGGDVPAMPISRPMPSIGKRVHELRLPDKNATWRVIYRVDPDAVVIADVFSKKTRKTPTSVIDACKKRFKRYDLDAEGSA